ncbi:hypothetical protein ERJ75_000121300 [Trypanosoma vivax]|nr:hypothetical protein ERJ75_000121300 [Trypanosoma vivax]
MRWLPASRCFIAFFAAAAIFVVNGAALSVTSSTASENHLANETMKLSHKLAEAIGKGTAIFTFLKNISDSVAEIVHQKDHKVNDSRLLQRIRFAREMAENSLKILKKCEDDFFAPPNSSYVTQFTITSNLIDIRAKFNTTLNFTVQRCMQKLLSCEGNTLNFVWLAKKSKEALGEWLSMDSAIKEGARVATNISHEAPRHINECRDSTVQVRLRDWSTMIDRIQYIFMYELGVLNGTALASEKNIGTALNELHSESEKIAAEEERERKKAEAELQGRIDEMKTAICTSIKHLKRIRQNVSGLKDLARVERARVSEGLRFHADALQRHSRIQNICAILAACQGAMVAIAKAHSAAQSIGEVYRGADESVSFLLANVTAREAELDKVKSRLKAVKSALVNHLEDIRVARAELSDQICDEWNITLFVINAGKARSIVSNLSALTSELYATKSDLHNLETNTTAMEDTWSGVKDIISKALEDASDITRTTNEAEANVTTSTRTFVQSVGRDVCQTETQLTKMENQLKTLQVKWGFTNSRVPAIVENVSRARRKAASTHALAKYVLSNISAFVSSGDSARHAGLLEETESSLLLDFASASETKAAEAERSSTSMRATSENLGVEAERLWRQLGRLIKDFHSNISEPGKLFVGTVGLNCSDGNMISVYSSVESINIEALRNISNIKQLTAHVEDKVQFYRGEVNKMEGTLDKVHILMNAAVSNAFNSSHLVRQADTAMKSILGSVLNTLKNDLCSATKELGFLVANFTTINDEVVNFRKNTAFAKRRAKAAVLSGMNAAAGFTDAVNRVTIAANEYHGTRSAVKEGIKKANLISSEVESDIQKAASQQHDISQTYAVFLNNILKNRIDVTNGGVCASERITVPPLNDELLGKITNSLPRLSELTNITNVKTLLEAIQSEVTELQDYMQNATEHANAAENAAQEAKAEMIKASKRSKCVPLYRQLLNMLWTYGREA